MGEYTTGSLGRLSWRRERGEVAAPIDPLRTKLPNHPPGYSLSIFAVGFNAEADPA